MTPVIAVEHLSKTYHLGQIGTGTVTNDLRVWWAKVRGRPNPLLKIGQTDHGNRDGEELWALRDVSFTVTQGEVLGIIGRNGAGKSTLLKILSRVTAPTAGQVKVKGRIASLLEVGTGFHPELTGRENIYLNGAILGMRRREIDQRFDEIVDFSGVEQFIDTPVKRYSSGMYVRLAFAVAAHLEPEILVVDEVLAVGDAEFQKKCLGKMGEVAQQGRTVLFVSHNLPMMQALCQQAFLLQRGALHAHGSTHQIIADYLAAGSTLSEGVMELGQHTGRSHSREPVLRRAWLEDGEGGPIHGIPMGGSLAFCFEFQANAPIANPIFGFGVCDEMGQRVFSLNNSMTPTAANTFRHLQAGTIRLFLTTMPLMPGTYTLDVSVVEDDRDWVDFVEGALHFQVTAADVYGSGRIPSHTQGKMYVTGSITVAPGSPKLNAAHQSYGGDRG